MKLHIYYEKNGKTTLAKYFLSLLPAVSGECHSEVSPWLTPVIHCVFLPLETGVVCLIVMTSAGGLEVLVRPWCQLLEMP